MKTQKIIFFASLLFIASCAPQSKQAYLEDYKEFILKIEKEHDSFSERDWNIVDRELIKFSDEYYSKYEKELTWQEEILVKKYEFQYNFYKIKGNSESFFNDENNEEYQKLKEQIDYYYKNDMQKDINELMEHAKRAGDSTIVIIEKIIKDLDKE